VVLLYIFCCWHIPNLGRVQCCTAVLGHCYSDTSMNCNFVICRWLVNTKTTSMLWLVVLWVETRLSQSVTTIHAVSGRLMNHCSMLLVSHWRRRAWLSAGIPRRLARYDTGTRVVMESIRIYCTVYTGNNKTSQKLKLAFSDPLCIWQFLSFCAFSE